MASSPLHMFAPVWDGWFREYVCGAGASDDQRDDISARTHRSVDNDAPPRARELAKTTTFNRDTDLVAKVRDGDVTAYTTLFETYYPTLVAFLRKYVNTLSEREDLAQETMMLLWQRRATLDPARSIRAFLFTVARHRALNHLDHERHTQDYAAELQTQSTTDSTFTEISADADAIAHELDRIVARHIRQLQPRQREIFQLSRGKGLSPAEIATVLGIATPTVYVQLSRIIRSLHETVSAWVKT